MIFKINNVDAPAPTIFEANYNTQQKSAERNSNGKLLRETLPDKWSLTCEWTFQTPEDFYTWFNVLKALTRVYFNIDFPAPTGSNVVAEFYISPISAKLLNYSRGTSGWWRTISCTFVEV